jgi:N-acetylglutamate synthase-like GNAT family acetyltransferase
MENPEQHKVKLRKATYDDLEEICDIYTQVFKGKTTPSTRQWWNILDNKDIAYYVVEQSGYVVGVASIIIINKLLRGGNRVGIIEDVAVSKYNGSRGVGSMLIEKLKEVAVERGCYKVVLSCADKNIEFYKKCGFYQNEVQMRWDRPAELGPKARNKGLF